VVRDGSRYLPEPAQAVVGSPLNVNSRSIQLGGSMSRQRPIRILLVAATLFGAAACTSDRSPAEPADEEEGVIVIRLGADLRFNPSSVMIPPGTTVRWVNDAAMFHTITPDSAGQPGAWTRRAVTGRNETFSHTFSEAGETYTYHCEPHLANGMTAVVRVQ
jgi:plastocyanin